MANRMDANGLVTAAALALLLPCCTAIGAGIGVVSDISGHSEFSGDEVDSVPVGEAVVVTDGDGREVRGTYRGHEVVSGSDEHRVDGVVVTSESGATELVPVADVREVEVGGGHGGLLTGALVGLVIDVGFLLLVAASGGASLMGGPPSYVPDSTCDENGSCY